MPKITTEAIMTCPNCGSKYKRKIPQIGKHINGKCAFCHTIFGIKTSNDCCIYCTYSDKLCPKAEKKLKKMNIPSNLLYTNDHEWVRIENHIAYIGITDFAQGELGDIVYVEIETIGEILNQNDVFGTVEAVKTVSDLFLPIKGEVFELNPKLETSPELVNTDPYGEGWMIKLKMEDNVDVEGLLKADAYALIIGS